MLQIFYMLNLECCHCVRVWISSDDVVGVAQKGFRLIHAASDYFYLVRPPSAWSIRTDILISAGLWWRWVGRRQSEWVSNVDHSDGLY